MDEEIKEIDPLSRRLYDAVLGDNTLSSKIEDMWGLANDSRDLHVRGKKLSNSFGNVLDDEKADEVQKYIEDAAEYLSQNSKVLEESVVLQKENKKRIDKFSNGYRDEVGRRKELEKRLEVYENMGPLRAIRLAVTGRKAEYYIDNGSKED